MMDEKSIKKLNKKMGKQARELEMEPHLMKNQKEIDKTPPFPFALFGDYRATELGWKMVKTYFVDASGLGTEDQPALTGEQFKKKLKVGRGYAVIEQGQFQVYVGEFIKTKKKAKK